MTDAAIPVDLFNPGQVFASLGFLEAADVLLGDAAGGFDWSDEAQGRFILQARGQENPFAVVLDFLASSRVVCCFPVVGGSAQRAQELSGNDEDDAGIAPEIGFSEAFPSSEADRMALPVRLECAERPSIELSHWTDGSSRDEFKLYAGNRTAHGIAHAMLHGTFTKPTKKQSVGDAKTRGIDWLWREQREALTARPFDVLTPMGGSFNFDPRGAWTSLDAGYSPNEQKHALAASPVVELLAALGLQQARPDEYQVRAVRYCAWTGALPPMLARPALSGVDVGMPRRRFRFALDLSGKNKVVTFAQEEK